MNANPQRRATGNRPALRIVKTTDITREEWLDVRTKGIGSSDAAAAVGLNPYKSQLELWLEKTGRDGNLVKPDPNDASSPLYWGTMLEIFVAAHYTKKTGNKVRRVNAVLQHPDYPWMLANLDREVVGCHDVQVLECKTAGINGAKLWRDGVPEYVELQVQHQLAVTSKQTADVAVLVCGNEFRTYRIQRNERLIKRLIELEQQFWHYVKTDTPPPADGSDSAATALQALYPQDNGEMVDFTGDTIMSSLFSDLVSVRAALSEQEKIELQLRQRIQERMGEASKAMFDTGQVSWKASKGSIVLDQKQLLQDQPDLMQKYSTTRPGSRRFVVLS